MATVHLIDTPKRTALTAHSTALRTTLKEWEKSFALSHDGRKPGKDDIKACPEIAKTYKEYNRAREVLAGKLGAEALVSPSARTNGKQKRRIEEQSSDVETKTKPALKSTPRKAREFQTMAHPSALDLYDPPLSASPRPYLRNAIGPTPQRDGKVLGLFDMLSNSGRSSQATPSTKKRKIDVCHEGLGQQGDGENVGLVAQTPSRKRTKGDLLDHLDGGFDSASKRRHTRTPASEGKKFMLSQFFATPNAMRFTEIAEEQEEDGVTRAPGDGDKTPLRAQVLGTRSQNAARVNQPAPDATPEYLKRSYSFKDRLLSVSTLAVGASRAQSTTDLLHNGFTSPSAVRTGPPTLRRYKSGPKPLSEIVEGLRKIEDERHDDDLDALREMEGGQVNVLVEDSQFADLNPAAEFGEGGDENQAPRRVWKKKGQKRTTRRANMKPVKMKPKDENKFVGEDGSNDDEEDLDAVEEMQKAGYTARTVSGDAHQTNMADDDNNVDTEGSDVGFVDAASDGNSEDDTDPSRPKVRSNKRPNHGKEAEGVHDMKHKTKDGRKGNTDQEKQKKGPTINPNAASHMNFRSLKIKNKNSKAKGGRGRFGRKGR